MLRGDQGRLWLTRIWIITISQSGEIKNKKGGGGSFRNEVEGRKTFIGETGWRKHFVGGEGERKLETDETA